MGRSDVARRKRAKRSGREAGCWIYISAETLHAAGIEPQDFTPDLPPFYRATGYRRSRNGHTVIVSLYREG